MPPTASTSVSVSGTRAAARSFDPRLILSLLAVYVIWGSTYYAMRVAVQGLPPMLMGSMRFIAAGLTLVAIARWRGGVWPTRRR